MGILSSDFREQEALGLREEKLRTILGGFEQFTLLKTFRDPQKEIVARNDDPSRMNRHCKSCPSRLARKNDFARNLAHFFHPIPHLLGECRGGPQDMGGTPFSEKA